MGFVIKVHDNPKGRVVAACDADILGETFDDGERALHVDESFYGGDEAELVDILEAMEDARTTNFVGEELIGELLESDLVEEDEVEEIGGIPHVQMYFI